MKSILFLFSLLFSSTHAFAFPDIDWVEEFIKPQMFCVEDEVKDVGMNWGLGDNAVYEFSLYRIFKGKLTLEVKEQVPEGFWVDEELDLGGFGEKNFRVLYDIKDGSALRLIVDGDEVAVPASTDLTSHDPKDEKIRIPAGIFKTLHLKTTDSLSQRTHDVWVNRKFAPFGGLLQGTFSTALGPLQLKALSFKKF